MWPIFHSSMIQVIRTSEAGDTEKLFWQLTVEKCTVARALWHYNMFKINTMHRFIEVVFCLRLHRNAFIRFRYTVGKNSFRVSYIILSNIIIASGNYNETLSGGVGCTVWMCFMGPKLYNRWQSVGNYWKFWILALEGLEKLAFIADNGKLNRLPKS